MMQHETIGHENKTNRRGVAPVTFDEASKYKSKKKAKGLLIAKYLALGIVCEVFRVFDSTFRIPQVKELTDKSKNRKCKRDLSILMIITYRSGSG